MRKSATLLLAVLLGFVLSGCPCDRDEDNPAGPGGTADTTRPTLVTPYAYQSEMNVINEAYSETTACPWGFVHLGIDFFPVGDLATFRAASAGTIERLERYHNPVSGTWQVNLDLRINSMYRLGYAFEPFSTNEAHADTQMANISVVQGQSVIQGQVLGRLLARGGGAHVHFSLYRDGTNVCPESYFTLEARDSILAILHRTFPGAFLCY
jgi:murein DD-endopeptidase MepM/ murein hydrolase activator NlpD